MNQPRVEVTSGDWSCVLGHGRLLGYTDVWVFQSRQTDRLALREITEYEPSEAVVRDWESRGARLAHVPSNPKIMLDSGEVVYGCQVWWRLLDESEDPMRTMDIGEPPPTRIKDILKAIVAMAESEGWPAVEQMHQVATLSQMQVDDWWRVRRLKAAIRGAGDKTALDIYISLALFVADAADGLTQGEQYLWGSMRSTKRKNN